jgi:hypothetical protein
VASLATIRHSRPATRPMPVTMPRAGRVAVVEFPRRQRRQFQKGCAGVEQAVDACAHKELALLGVTALRRGEYPYTRGSTVHATLHRGKLWTMRMFAGFGTAEETNRASSYLLSQGTTPGCRSPSTCRRSGLRQRRARALGEFGKCGVAISSPLATWSVLSTEIPSTRHHLDDDQLPGGDHLGDVHRRGREAGRPGRQAGRHAAERHPQGVHRAEGVHLPAAPVDAPGDRHRGVRRAEMPSWNTISHQRLPHPRGRQPPRRRSWPSRWPTASPTSRLGAAAGWTSTRSPRA